MPPVAAGAAVGASRPTLGSRVRSVDWHRGFVVLVMIECHALVFLTPAHDADPLRGVLDLFNRLPAPSFLFLAGFSLAFQLARASSDAERLKSARKKTLRRTVGVLIAANVMRCVSTPALTSPAWSWWCQIDVLSCIGYCLLVVWALFRCCGSHIERGAIAAFVAAAALVMVSPWTEKIRGIGPLVTVFNNSSNPGFPLVPWCALALLGAVTGVATARYGKSVQLGALTAFVLAGVALTAASPPIIAVFGDRLWRMALTGVVAAALAAAIKADSRPTESGLLKLLTFFGNRSMTAYVAHLLLLYGAWGFKPLGFLHQNLGWAGYAAAALGLIAATFGICLIVDRVATVRANEKKSQAD